MNYSRISHCRYTSKTLPEGHSDAAHYGNGGGSDGGSVALGDHISNAFAGLGVRSALLVAVSALCLFLASVGVCVCLRKSKLAAKTCFSALQKVIRQFTQY